jgi:hypothetical protein
MMRRLSSLRGDRRGATLAELALTLPVWLILIFGVFNVGRFYWARAGIRNGLGDAATIRLVFAEGAFGLTSSETPVVSITPGTANGQACVDIAVTYDPEFFLVGLTTKPVSLNYTRRAFRLT